MLTGVLWRSSASRRGRGFAPRDSGAGAFGLSPVQDGFLDVILRQEVVPAIVNYTTSVRRIYGVARVLSAVVDKLSPEGNNGLGYIRPPELGHRFAFQYAVHCWRGKNTIVPQQRSGVPAVASCIGGRVVHV